MATPPTLAADYQTSSWNTTTTPKTISVTAASGTTLVAVAINSEYGSGTYTLPTPTGGPTWTARQSQGPGASSRIEMWTATSAGDYTHSQTLAGGVNPVFGASVWVYSGSDGYDASAGSYDETSAVAQQAVTTTTDNCAIVWVAGDYNANDDAARAYLAINGGAGIEDFYVRDASYYTVYGVHWTDAGAAGAKTAGLSTYEANLWLSQAVVAIKGTAGAAPALPYWGARVG